MYTATCKQDEFVANILKFKKNGIYVDIGSCESKNANNSYYFDSELNWKGICVEIQKLYESSYALRKNCKLIIDDATQLNYKKIFEEQNFLKEIDYLSLDVDTLSFSVLNILPFDDYDFKVITIEHDSYLYGDTYKKPQRDFLQNKGYVLLCSDVYVEHPGYYDHYGKYGKQESFEDWYVNPNYFENNFLNKIKSNLEYPSEIIKKFN
jgi:hypothetical protein